MKRKGGVFAFHGRGLSLIVLALALLYTAACGAPASALTVSTRATATPVPHLAFHPITLPPGFDVRRGSLAVSPIDGKDAWACLASGAGAFQIWATTDEGVTWHAAGLLHPVTPEQPRLYWMGADQRDTKAAVFGVGWGSGEAGDLASMSFYTRDGGAHWQQLPGWTGLASVNTDGDTTYAVISITTPPAGQPQAALLASLSPPRYCAPCSGPGNQERMAFVVSSDGLRTWRELHPGGLTSQDAAFQLWYGPASGEVFAATTNGGLWHSLNSGSSWTQASTPVEQVSLGRWLASRKAWMFCGEQGRPPVTMCSTDTGNTWRQVPILTSTVHVQCDAWCHQKGGQDSQTSTCPTFALGADGSLLAACPMDSAASGPGQFMAYRFAPGATSWAVLGPVPSQSCQVSANGSMWCLDADNAEWETVTLPA